MPSKAPREVAAARRQLSRIMPFTKWAEARCRNLEEAFVWLSLTSQMIEAAQLDPETEGLVREVLEVDLARMLPPTVLTGPWWA